MQELLWAHVKSSSCFCTRAAYSVFISWFTKTPTHSWEMTDRFLDLQRWLWRWSDLFRIYAHEDQTLAHALKMSLSWLCFMAKTQDSRDLHSCLEKHIHVILSSFVSRIPFKLIIFVKSLNYIFFPWPPILRLNSFSWQKSHCQPLLTLLAGSAGAGKNCVRVQCRIEQNENRLSWWSRAHRILLLEEREVFSL